MKPEPRRLLHLFLLSAVLCGTALALDPAVAVLRKSNAALKRIVLENGMVCLLKEDRSAPVVAVQIWVGTGSVHEGEYLGAGLSHYVEHMIFKGTPTRPMGAITRQINDAGGTINAYTGHSRTVFHTDLPSDTWMTGLVVLADAVLNASFPEKEWQTEKDVILREFAMGRDDPDRVVSKLLFKTAYRAHPYRVPVIGYEDIFREISREDLVGFFRAHYVVNNMIVAIVGDISEREAETAVRSVFEHLPRRRRPPTVLPVEPPQAAPRYARKTGAYNLSRMRVAYPTVPLRHRDTPALDLLAMIVGAGRSSRLVREIKETRKLVQDISAWSWTPGDPGLFSIAATFVPANEQPVLDAIDQQIEQWRQNPFTPDEIEKARRMVLSSELARMETMHGQADNYAAGEFYAGDPCFSEQYLANLQAVSAADLDAVLRTYLKPEKRTLVLLGPEPPAADTVAAEARLLPSKVGRHVLPNGIRVLTREDSRLPFVHLCATFGGGLLSETEGAAGITRLTATMMTRGTRKRSAQDIARTVESRGGSLTTFSGRNSFGIRAKCLARDLKVFMKLLADCVCSPTFTEEETGKQKTLQAGELKLRLEQPFAVAEDELRELLFAQHPYRWHPLGTPETLRALTRQDLVEHHRRLVTGANMILAVFGDVTPHHAREYAERYMKPIPRGASPPCTAVRPHRPAAQPTLPARTEQQLPRQQAVLLMGYPGTDVSDPRRAALEVLRKSLSGLSSELSMKTREEKGLVYYVGAYQMLGLDPGMFVLYAGTHREGAPEVERIVNKEMTRIAAKGISEEELHRARTQLIAKHKMDLQSVAATAFECTLNELYGLGYEYTFALEQRIRAVSNADVRQAAVTVLNPKRQAVSLVLPHAREHTIMTKEKP